MDTPSQRRLPLSLLLLGIGAALTIAVSSWLGFLANGKDVALEIKEVEGTETGEVQLSGARYRGLTPGGKPYEITAALANESPDGSGRVDMNQPTAVFALNDGSIVNLKSDVGVFNKQTNIVPLTKKRNIIVTFTRLKNYRLYINNLNFFVSFKFFL